MLLYVGTSILGLFGFPTVRHIYLFGWLLIFGVPCLFSSYRGFRVFLWILLATRLTPLAQPWFWHGSLQPQLLAEATFKFRWVEFIFYLSSLLLIFFL